MILEDLPQLITEQDDAVRCEETWVAGQRVRRVYGLIPDTGMAGFVLAKIPEASTRWKFVLKHWLQAQHEDLSLKLRIGIKELMRCEQVREIAACEFNSLDHVALGIMGYVDHMASGVALHQVDYAAGEKWFLQAYVTDSSYNNALGNNLRILCGLLAIALRKQIESEV